MKLHTAASKKGISNHAGIQPYAPTTALILREALGLIKKISAMYFSLTYYVRTPVSSGRSGSDQSYNDLTPKLCRYLEQFCVMGGSGTASDLQVSAVPHPLDSVGRSRPGLALIIPLYLYWLQEIPEFWFITSDISTS